MSGKCSGIIITYMQFSFPSNSNQDLSLLKIYWNWPSVGIAMAYFTWPISPDQKSSDKRMSVARE